MPRVGTLTKLAMSKMQKNFMYVLSFFKKGGIIIQGGTLFIYLFKEIRYACQNTYNF